MLLMATGTRSTLLRARSFEWHSSRGLYDHVLLLTFHHSICDAWSIWLLLDEFRQLYPAMAARQPGRLLTCSDLFLTLLIGSVKCLRGPMVSALLPTGRSSSRASSPLSICRPLHRSHWPMIVSYGDHFFLP